MVGADHTENADLVQVKLEVRALHTAALKHLDGNLGAICFVIADIDLTEWAFSYEPLLTHIKVIVLSDITSLSGGTQYAKPSVHLLLGLEK